MNNTPEQLHAEEMQRTLRDVQNLLVRQKREEGLVHRQVLHGHEDRRELVENLAHKQNVARLTAKLTALHPADIAFILEALPLDDRLFIWDLIRSHEIEIQDGEVLLEVSDAVRESLIESMDTAELVAAAEQLDTDELADLAPDLPKQVMDDIYLGLNAEEREQLRAAMSYENDAVGALMDFEMVSVREDVSLEVVLRYLRRFDALPDHTDQLFVVDREERLLGVLPVQRLLINDPEERVGALMLIDVLSLHPGDKADDAAQAFERYDLVSAPVTDRDRRLVGRLTVASVMDFLREKSEAELLGQAGLKEEEDIFASVWSSLKNRWGWLAINLVTAFVASRVIGAFEGSIEKLVALATLMPIIAGIGGNSGNQTITMIVRAIAVGQIQAEMLGRLMRKELTVALINGLVWGSLLGIIALILYRNWALGLVMAAATTLNLLLAAFMGVIIPMTMLRLDKDPAVGSSVLITACTDSGGFFIFLGLATLWLL